MVAMVFKAGLLVGGAAAVWSENTSLLFLLPFLHIVMFIWHLIREKHQQSG